MPRESLLLLLKVRSVQEALSFKSSPKPKVRVAEAAACLWEEEKEGSYLAFREAWGAMREEEEEEQKLSDPPLISYVVL